MKFDLGPSPHLRTARPANRAPAGADSLQSIEDALDRLDAGEFGYCETCGVAIALSRLCLDPTVSHCRDCDDT